MYDSITLSGFLVTFNWPHCSHPPGFSVSLLTRMNKRFGGVATAPPPPPPRTQDTQLTFRIFVSYRLFCFVFICFPFLSFLSFYFLSFLFFSFPFISFRFFSFHSDFSFEYLIYYHCFMTNGLNPGSASVVCLLWSSGCFCWGSYWNKDEINCLFITSKFLLRLYTPQYNRKQNRSTAHYTKTDHAFSLSPPPALQSSFLNDINVLPQPI